MGEPGALVDRRRNSAGVTGIELVVQHVDADFEVANRSPRGAGTDLPGAPIARAASRDGSSGTSQSIQLDLRVATVGRGLPLRVPVMLVRRTRAPGGRQVHGVSAIHLIDAIGVGTRTAGSTAGHRIGDGRRRVLVGALGPVELGLDVVTSTEHRQVHARTGAEGVADSVGRMTRESDVIVAAAGVMDRTHDLSTAPSLIDAQVGDDIRVLVTGLAKRRAVNRSREAENASSRLADDAAAGSRCRHGTVTRVFGRDRGRQTVAELSSVGENLIAAVTGIGAAGGPDVATVIRHGRVVHVVVERLRQTGGETSELDERTVGAEAGAALGTGSKGTTRRGATGRSRHARDRVVVRQTDRDVTAQRTVFGLRAGIGRDVTTVAGHEVVGRAVVDVGGHRTVGHVAVVAVAHLHTDPTANLDASIGARDVIETRTVQATNLHVLTYDYRIASDSTCL